MRAYSYWSDVTTLTFKPVASNGDFNILFASGAHNDEEPFDGRGGTLAHVFVLFYK